MNTDSGRTRSVWMNTAPDPENLVPLHRDAACDVCIVGAGIAGLSVAYECVKRGHKVVVIDDGPVGGGETGRTTAHLTFALDDRYYELERLFGADGARLAADSHKRAVDYIEQVVMEEKIDCDFVRLDGYLFVPPEEKDDQLKDELEASHRAGLADIAFTSRAPIEDFDTGPALRFPNQGQFHPLKYLNGLVRAITARDGRIFTSTRATDFKAGEEASVTTQNGKQIRCKHIVVATNTPVNDMVVMHTKQMPYRTYVVGCRVPKHSVTRALYWDTPDPYHYVRLQEMPDYDILIVGGEDHKTGQATDFSDLFHRLSEWAKQRWPMIESVDFHWSGQVMEPVDCLGYIGRNPGNEPNIYIHTGDSGNGMTHGTIAGMLLADLIEGKENPWAQIYDPSRKTLRTAPEYARENLNVAIQYRDWITPGEVESVDDIPNDTGAVIRRGLHKVAAYRDSDGHVHECSATCTHLQCIVNWNEREKSWDCPCHGSRFDPYGRVINGPAAFDLKQLDGGEQPQRTAAEAPPPGAAAQGDWRPIDESESQQKPAEK